MVIFFFSIIYTRCFMAYNKYTFTQFIHGPCVCSVWTEKYVYFFKSIFSRINNVILNNCGNKRLHAISVSAIHSFLYNIVPTEYVCFVCDSMPCKYKKWLLFSYPAINSFLANLLWFSTLWWLLNVYSWNHTLKKSIIIL